MSARGKPGMSLEGNLGRHSLLLCHLTPDEATDMLEYWATAAWANNVSRKARGQYAHRPHHLGERWEGARKKTCHA